MTDVIRYNPFGVTVTRKQIFTIANAMGKTKSPQTVANWINYYGSGDQDIEVLLKTKLGITTKYELEKKLEYPTADMEFEARQAADLKAMGFQPFEKEEKQKQEAEALSEAEKEILETMGYVMDEKTDETEKAPEPMIVEEPVDNVPDKTDLKLVNMLIHSLAKVRTIPGFDMDAIREAEETLKAARGVFFGHLIDWEALAKEA